MGPDHTHHFMIQAEKIGIEELLSIPNVVVLSCLLYNESRSLPNRTELIEKVIHETIRKALKKYKLEFSKDKIDTLLAMLGKLSWEGLQRSSKQLHIQKVWPLSVYSLSVSSPMTTLHIEHLLVFQHDEMVIVSVTISRNHTL